MNVAKTDTRLLMPVLAGFFIMGFCDMVAPVTCRIAAEFPFESRRAVDFLPAMVFFWFLLLSIPVAAWMNRCGRKRTALAGYAFTFVGLSLSFVAGEEGSLGLYFAGFGLLGIGNTIVQVAVNPLLASIVPVERMTGFLTVGQIFRNLSLLLVAPLVAFFSAWMDSWRGLLLLYALMTVVGGIWLQATAVPEPDVRMRAVGFADCFRLLRNRTVLLCVGGVACFIAADIGINFVAVRLIDSPSTSLMTSMSFYACRIVGTLVGAWLLIRYSDVKYLCLNMGAALLLCLGLLFVRDWIAIYAITGVLGFAMSCVFATFYAVATKAAADKSNEVAGLMIMAISAGVLSGPVCGALIAWTDNPHIGIGFPLACVAYMGWAAVCLNRKKLKTNEYA